MAHHPSLTRLLIERGADPNDGEVAYHTPETLDNRAMKVLVESGKLTAESMMWLLARKLNWHDDDGMTWLLAHGADPTRPGQEGVTPFALAAHRARADVLELFENPGFTLALHGADAFLAACARGDEAAARRIADDDEGIVQRLQSQNSGLIVDFAGAAGNTGALRLMLDLGFDANCSRSEPK